MSVKSRVRFAVVAVIAVLLVTACQQQASPSPSGSAAGYRLATQGKFTIGYSPSPGISDVVDGQPVGVGLYLATEMAKRLGLEPVYQSYGFAALFPALQTHRIDFIGSLIAGTQPRAQVLYVNQPPTLWGPETLIVRPGTTIESWEDAAARGLTLASVKGYFQITAFEELGITVHAFDNDDACMTDVLNGGADGCAVGSFGLIYRKATQPDDTLSGLEQIVVTGPQIVTEGSVFATARDNPVLARNLDQMLRDMWRDGTVELAYDSVFGDVDYSAFLDAPEGSNFYLLGAWEEGVRPPASESFQDVKTVADGILTVGVPADSELLRIDGDKVAGPEGAILKSVAESLGMKLKPVKITDEAGSLNGNAVDLVAGHVDATPERTSAYWMTQPFGFSPDYIYVKPGEDGSFPAYTSWESIKEAGGKIAVVGTDPRLADVQASGTEVLTVDSAAAGLKAVVDGSALGFVGSTVDYALATSQDPTIGQAGVGYIRNTNTYTHGDAFAWGVKAGNGVLLDALDQALTLAWQNKTVGDAYGAAWPGGDVSAIQAPGPALVGSGFGTTKDFVMRSIWMPGAWQQRPGYVQ